MTRAPLILALDLSPKATGVAMGDGSAAPHTASVSFNSQPGDEAIWAAFCRWMSDHIMVQRPDLIVIEAPILKLDAQKSAATMWQLMGMAVNALTIAELHGIRAHKVQVQSWRKSFVGHGRPTDPKAATLETCRMIGWDVQGSHDRADAAGVFAHAHLTWGNRQGMHRMLSAGSFRRMEVRHG